MKQPLIQQAASPDEETQLVKKFFEKLPEKVRLRKGLICSSVVCFAFVTSIFLEITSSKIAQERSVDQQYLFVANATEISDIKRKRGSFLEIQSIGSGGSVFGVISDQIQIPFKYPKSFRIDPSANWDLSSTPRRSRRSNAIDWAWRYGDSTLLPLGLTDQVHRSKHGKSASQIVDVNGRGMAIGISTRFKQMVDATDSTRTGIQDPFGHSAWLWNGKKTIRIGHYEPEFQSFSGWDPGPNPTCLLYTSPSPRDLSTSRMPSSA